MRNLNSAQKKLSLIEYLYLKNFYSTKKQHFYEKQIKNLNFSQRITPEGI